MNVPEIHRPPSRIIVTFVMSLLTASFMWPSEGAIYGDGLHLTVLWLLAAGCTLWQEPRSQRYQDSNPVRCAGIGILLLTAGFWISTWYVFHISGDRRDAFNLTCEWLGIAGAAWTCHEIFRISAVRQQFMKLLAGLVLGTALMGIVQHHVTYTQQGEWYRSRREALDAAKSESSFESVQTRRKIEAEFSAAGIPLSGAGRDLFEKRLLASSEPIGPFALANTLAGLLAVGLTLIAGNMLQKTTQQRKIRHLVITGVTAVVIGYCLILTKSRTAWVASMAGGILLAASSRISAKRLRNMVLATVVLTSAVLGAGIGTGAIDKEVVLESPRSLQFRLFYWMGAAQVIQESPLFGSGPGNFRQGWLKHKPVEASEEILDPHNILFDAWCSAGFIGFLGAIFIAYGLLARTVAGKSSAASLAPEQADSDKGKLKAEAPCNSRGPALVPGIMVGTLLHLIWSWSTGGTLWDSGDFASSDNLVLLVPFGAVVVAMVVRESLAVSHQVIAAAGTVLIIHLLGAGGLQVTAVGLLLGTLTAASAAESRRVATTTPQVVRVIQITILTGLVGIVLIFGLIPRLRSTWYDTEATVQQHRNRPAEAAAALATGAALDPWSVKLRQRRAELLAYQLQQAAVAPARFTPKDASGLRDRYLSALEACQQLINADQNNWRSYHLRSRVHAAAAQLQLNPDAEKRAVDDIAAAVRMYPTNAALCMELAIRSEQSGNLQLAKSAATDALTIEESNRNWGHSDRYLDADQLSIAERILNQ